MGNRDLQMRPEAKLKENQKVFFLAFPIFLKKIAKIHLTADSFPLYCCKSPTQSTLGPFG